MFCNQSYHVGRVQPLIVIWQVQPINFFMLEDWMLDIDGMNSCSFLAVSVSSAHSLGWLVD